MTELEYKKTESKKETPSTPPAEGVSNDLLKKDIDAEKLAEILNFVKKGVESKKIGFQKTEEAISEEQDKILSVTELKNELTNILNDLQSMKTGTKEMLLEDISKKQREYFNITKDDNNEKLIDNNEKLAIISKKIEKKLRKIAEEVASAFIDDIKQMKKDVTNLLDRVKESGKNFDPDDAELGFYINKAGDLRGIVALVKNNEYLNYLDDIDDTIANINSLIDEYNKPKTVFSAYKNKKGKFVFGAGEKVGGIKNFTSTHRKTSSIVNKEIKSEVSGDSDFGSFIKTPTIDKGDFDDLDLGENTVESEGFEDSQTKDAFVSKLSDEYREKEKTSDQLFRELIDRGLDKTTSETAGSEIAPKNNKDNTNTEKNETTIEKKEGFEIPVDLMPSEKAFAELTDEQKKEILSIIKEGLSIKTEYEKIERKLTVFNGKTIDKLSDGEKDTLELIERDFNSVKASGFKWFEKSWSSESPYTNFDNSFFYFKINEPFLDKLKNNIEDTIKQIKKEETKETSLETSTKTEVITDDKEKVEITPVENKTIKEKLYSFVVEGVKRGTGLKFWVDAYNAIANKSGDLHTFFTERKTKKEEKERIESAMDSVLEYSLIRRREKEGLGIEVSKFNKVEVVKEEKAEEIEVKKDTQERLSDSIKKYKEAIEKSTLLTPEKKKELNKQLAYMIAEHVNKQERLGIMAVHKQSDILTYYLETKVKGIDMLKHAITGVLTPLTFLTGPIGRGVRGAVYAGMSLYQKAKGESIEYNIKGKEQERLRRKIEVFENLKKETDEKRADIVARHRLMSDKKIREKYGVSKSDFKENGEPLTEGAEIALKKEKALIKQKTLIVTPDKTEERLGELKLKEKAEKSTRVGSVLGGFKKSATETVRALFGRGFNAESTTKGRDFAQALGRVTAGAGIVGPVLYDFLRDYFGEDTDISFKENAIDDARENIQKNTEEEPVITDVNDKDLDKSEALDNEKILDQNIPPTNKGNVENLIKPKEDTGVVDTRADINTSKENTSIDININKENISHDVFVKEIRETNFSTLKPVEVQSGDSMWRIVHREVGEQMKIRGELRGEFGLTDKDFDINGNPITEDAKNVVNRMTAEFLRQNNITDKVIIHPGDEVSVEYDMNTHRNIIKINGEEVGVPVEKGEGDLKDVITKNSATSDDDYIKEVKDTEKLIPIQEGLNKEQGEGFVDEKLATDEGVSNKQEDVKTENIDNKDVKTDIGEKDLKNDNKDEALEKTTSSTKLDDKYKVEKDFTVSEGNVITTPKGTRIDLDDYSIGGEKIEADYFNKSDNVLLTLDKGNGVKECIILDQIGGKKLDIVFGGGGLRSSDSIMIGGEKIETEDSFKNMSLNGKYPNVIIDGKKAILKITETGLFAKKQGEKIDIPIARFDE